MNDGPYRFGPDVMAWRDCKTPKDYIRRGLTQASGFYIGTGGILLLMSAAMGRSPVTFVSLPIRLFLS